MYNKYKYKFFILTVAAIALGCVITLASASNAIATTTKIVTKPSSSVNSNLKDADAKVKNNDSAKGDNEEKKDNASIEEAVAPRPLAPQDLKKLETVIAEIKHYYVKPVSDHELLDNAISGMLYGLDPHSEYLKKEDIESLSALTVGKFGGIGVEVIPYQGLIKVVSPLDDTPAAKAGIKAGDIIVQINNKLVKDMQLHDAIKLMRGPKGSKVTLTILRKNSPKPLLLKISRSIIKIKAVKERLLEKNLGYVRIAFFQESTSLDFAKAVTKLRAQAGGSLTGLILDLRNNPGGLLDPAVQVADSLLDTQSDKKFDNIIVYTKGNNKSSFTIAQVTPGELLLGTPLVVLINEGSASASEVLAGALQDYKRAVIVGTKSFGKGSVQTVLYIDDDSALKLTTALYYTPAGRSIQAKGIEPDVVISDIKIPEKTSVEDDDVARIDEASLVDHLQNGNDGNDDKDKSAANNNNNVITRPTSNDGVQSAEENIGNGAGLIYKDYQLYGALNILRGLMVAHNK